MLYSCKQCFLSFEKKQQLAGHVRKHSRPFEVLRKDGSRKKRLLEERGHQCERCKNIEWMGEKIPLEIDHIDGHPGHNEKENLRLLCPNCHSQQPTHAGKNVGKHSGTRRQEVMARYPSYRK